MQVLRWRPLWVNFKLEDVVSKKEENLAEKDRVVNLNAENLANLVNPEKPEKTLEENLEKDPEKDVKFNLF